MKNVRLGATRNITQLRRGDIIHIDAPFEENTKDYYNGYAPEKIRGRKFTDRFGNSSKKRMVIYIGRDNQTLYYLPVTSKQKQTDLPHQYELKDNSMTPKADENTHSYVECENLRAIDIPFGTNIDYTNRINKEDLYNILHRISNIALHLTSNRDKRGYILPEAKETFEKELTDRGFKVRQETEDRKVWKNQNVTITQTKYGLVHYHVDMSKQAITDLVSKREGRDITRDKQSCKANRSDIVKKRSPKKRHHPPRKQQTPNRNVDTVKGIPPNQSLKVKGGLEIT